MNPLETAALRRARRLASPGTGVQGAFSGALQNRLNADWILAGIQSADQEVRQNLKVLKARSRELARNNPHAKRYLEIKGDNLIGDEGIALQAHVKDPSGNLRKEINKTIEDGWKEWSEVGICTADGKHAWTDVERLTVDEEARDGDGFIRLLPAWTGNRFGFALQLIDPDQIDVGFDQPGGFDSNGVWHNEIRMGVEQDEWGRPVAFHIWGAHPSEPGGREMDRTRVPAEQMVHWFRPYRVGQSRGVPDFAPVLMTIKMLAGYEEAELTASRIAAAKGGFFERTSEALQLLETGGSLDKEKDRKFSMEVEPGLFESLPPGWKFSQWDPSHPTSAFPDFHKAMLRTIATGLGVSYNVLAQDLEGVSFSSIRTGMLSERDTWKSMQGNLWRHVHQKIYREWLKWSVTTGALDLPTRNPRDYHRVAWQPRGWDWVDPKKDAETAEMEIEMGVNSRTRIAASKGRNYEDILEERAHEEELARAMGVDVSVGRRSRNTSEQDDAEERDQEARHAGEPAPKRAPRNRIETLLRSGERARTGRGRLLLSANGNGREPHGPDES